METYSLEFVRQLAFHNHCKLQRTGKKAPKSYDEHIQRTSPNDKGQINADRRLRAAGPNKIYRFGIEQSIEGARGSVRAYPVVHHPTENLIAGGPGLVVV